MLSDLTYCCLLRRTVLTLGVVSQGGIDAVDDLWPYYIKDQQDATLAVSFISHCKITLHVSDAFCVHHQEYYKL